jgi:hypothetical protein
VNDDDTGVIILLLPLLRSSATRSSSFAVINVADSWCSILVSLRRGFCDLMCVLYTNSQKQLSETKTIALFSRRRKNHLSRSARPLLSPSERLSFSFCARIKKVKSAVLARKRVRRKFAEIGLVKKARVEHPKF